MTPVISWCTAARGFSPNPIWQYKHTQPQNISVVVFSPCTLLYLSPHFSPPAPLSHAKAWLKTQDFWKCRYLFLISEKLSVKTQSLRVSIQTCENMRWRHTRCERITSRSRGASARGAHRWCWTSTATENLHLWTLWPSHCPASQEVRMCVCMWACVALLKNRKRMENTRRTCSSYEHVYKVPNM